jgi:hypothetical protein
MMVNEVTGELPMCIAAPEFRQMYPEQMSEFEFRVLAFEGSDPYRSKHQHIIKHVAFGMGTCPTAATTTLELGDLMCWAANAEIMKDKHGDLAANIPCANFPGFLVFSLGISKSNT